MPRQFEHKSRREALGTIGAAALAGGVATAAHPAFASSSPDAHLLRLGAAFDRFHAAWLPLYAEVERLNGPFEEEWAKRGLSIDANFAAWGQLREEMGVEPVIEAEERVFKLIDAVTTKIRETPAKTFAGLAVKARALRFDAHLSTLRRCLAPMRLSFWKSSSI